MTSTNLTTNQETAADVVVVVVVVVVNLGSISWKQISQLNPGGMTHHVVVIQSLTC